jgi:quercetin dioxygenase-like cupin family protein
MIESIWFTDALVRVHVTPEDTNGAYALLEALVPPGQMPPPHIHEQAAGSFLVLEGEITLHTKDGPTVVRPGQSGHVPAGEAHTACVTSIGAARVVIVSAPSGLADYIRACGRPAERAALPVPAGPLDVGLLVREARAHGITVLGPPGAPPVDSSPRRSAQPAA